MAFLRTLSGRSLAAWPLVAALIAGCSGDDDDSPTSPAPPLAYYEPPAALPCGRTGTPPPESKAFDRMLYGFVGHWVGTATPSFSSDSWPVEITFRDDGSYTAVRYGEEPHDGPLYYGVYLNRSVTSTYELLDLTDNGEVTGEIGVPFDSDRVLIGAIERAELDERLGHLSFVFRPDWLSSGSPRITYELSCVPERGPGVTPAR